MSKNAHPQIVYLEDMSFSINFLNANLTDSGKKIFLKNFWSPYVKITEFFFFFCFFLQNVMETRVKLDIVFKIICSW